MSDTTTGTSSTGPKFKKGDIVLVPGHGGLYAVEVVRSYANLAEAESKYEKSYQTILKRGMGSVKHAPNAIHYYGEVANKTRAPVGFCELDAKLKSAAPVPAKK